MHCVGRVKFYWRHSKAVTAIWAARRLVELLSWIMMKRKQTAAGRRHLWRFFFILCGHGVKNRVRFGHSWNENVYLCTYAKCLSICLFLLFAEARPSVQFVTASLGNVVTGKKNKNKIGVTISPEDAQSKTNCLCVVFNMDSECFFHFWGTSTKKVNDTVCHCCTVSVKYEYCVLYCRNPENKVAKKAIIYSSIPVCVFQCSVLISQRWSLSLTVSASICVVYSHLFHIENYIKTYS